MEIIGDLLQSGTEGGYLHLHTEIAKLRVGVLSDSSFRIQACRHHEVFLEGSYAIEAIPDMLPQNFTEKANEITVETALLRLVINKAPLRFRFETLDGNVISEDDRGLGIAWDGREVSNYRVLQPGERFLGLGEKTGPLDKAGKQYRNWNTDAFGYTPSTDPLYVSCPFFIGLSHERPYGIFLNNHSETVFNFGAANDRFTFFQAASGQLDYFFFGGPEPADILRDYTALTGRMPMPPMWSLGFQQCRYSYYPDSELLRVARTFRELRIPVDVIYFDIHYMQNFKVFTWHSEHFPNPKALIDELRQMGFKVVVILDPGIKVEPGYEVYDEGSRLDVFAKYPDGEPYRGAAWPGWCQFPDFTDARVREWWGQYVSRLVDMGVDGFWNDMNEPAVWGHFTPNAVQFSLEGKKGSHKEAHNVYGMQMTRATARGAEQAMQGKRPFVLTRATFSGGQRDSALWTGDNFANDEHMLLGARMVSGMGLSGFPFVGNDVGGFTGDASAALYRRWMAYAAFHPLMRAHTMINSKHAEPWSFGEECTEIARNYIKLRYALLPHLYSLFHEAAVNGMPPVRSLAFRFFKEWKVFSKEFQNQFLLGDHLLICPVAAEDLLAKVYLPKGRWYNFFNDTLYDGEAEHLVELHRDTIPVFVQAGGIIPTQSHIEHTAQKGDGCLYLHIYTGGEGKYLLYEDDGISTASECCKREIVFRNGRVEISAATGNWSAGFSKLRMYIHGGKVDEVRCNGENLQITRKDFRFIEAISNFDPYENYPDGAKRISLLASIDLELSRESIGIEIF